MDIALYERGRRIKLDDFCELAFQEVSQVGRLLGGPSCGDGGRAWRVRIDWDRGSWVGWWF